MTNLEQTLQYRRSVRVYQENQPIDTEIVKKCIQLATLAPNSSNMQLWEFIHVTSPEVLAKLSVACFDQSAAKTAQQMVVFVARRDLYKKRAKQNLEFAKQEILKNSPKEKQEKRIKKAEGYYGKAIPFLYMSFFKTMSVFRKIIAFSVGLFRPMYRQVSESNIQTVVHKSCALAAQTFMLAMAEQQFDTCPMEGFDSARVKKILNLPCSAEINMIVSCGIRKPEGIYGERFRVPFDEVYRKI